MKPWRRTLRTTGTCTAGWAKRCWRSGARKPGQRPGRCSLALQVRHRVGEGPGRRTRGDGLRPDSGLPQGGGDRMMTIGWVARGISPELKGSVAGRAGGHVNVGADSDDNQPGPSGVTENGNPRSHRRDRQEAASADCWGRFATLQCPVCILWPLIRAFLPAVRHIAALAMDATRCVLSSGAYRSRTNLI